MGFTRDQVDQLVHPEKLIREEVREHPTAYCSLCAKHYETCHETLYKEGCSMLRHEGKHLGTGGSEWEDNDNPWNGKC